MKTVNTSATIFFLLCLNCIHVAEPTKVPEGHIRVAIGADLDGFIFSSTGRGKIIGSNKYLRFRTGDTIRVAVNGPTLTLRSQRGLLNLTDSLIYFIADKKICVVNNKKYAGYLVFRFTSGRNFLINILPVEEYLRGVVPSELGWITKNIYQAILSQTIAARTYAYSHRNNYDKLGFDVHGTVQDQVYDGLNVENELVNEAIKKTRGLILTYRDRPIDAKYHSTCGGRTANFFDIWSDTTIPYLVSVEDPFCNKSPHATWQDEISFAKLMKNLGSDSLSNERIKKIVLKRNPQSCRVVEITVVTNLREEKIPKYRIRKTLVGEVASTGMLKSTYLDMVSADGKIKITGRGYGHGVGMCQFGAMEMARQGFDFKRILKHYYPNTKLSKKKFN